MPGHTVEDRLRNELLGGDSPSMPWTTFKADDGSIWAFNRLTGALFGAGSPGGAKPIVPAAEVTASSHWVIEADPSTGALFLIDLAAPSPADTKKPLTEGPAPDEPKPLIREALIPYITDRPDGSKLLVYDFRPYGGKLETYVVPKGKEPFELGKVQDRDGIKFIEVAEGQFEMLPTKFQPDVVERSGRLFIQQPNGQLQPLPKEYEAGLKNIGGRSFIQQPDGSLSPLAREFQPGVVTIDGKKFVQQPNGQLEQMPETFEQGIRSFGGREFLQQRSGQLGELAPRTSTAVMDQIIAEAIIAGDVDKALAYQDFRDRPTEQDALTFALQFARSPADQQVISALARGELTVEQRPSTPTRVGPQPDFLIKAFNQFQQALTGGRAPTGAEASFFLGGPQRRGEAAENAKIAALEARASAAEAQAQSAWEKAFQAGLGTVKAGGGLAPTAAKAPELKIPTAEQARTVSSGELSGQGFQVPTFSAGAKSQQVLQQVMSLPESRYSPNQIEGINWIAEHGSLTGFPGLNQPKPMAEGGIVFGPTNAILGEEGPEAVIPLNKPENFPFGVRQLQAGRQISPPTGNLFRTAGLQIPSAQALMNLTPEDLTFFRDLGAQAGIPQGAFEQELRLGLPGGSRVRAPLFMPFLARN